MEKIDLIKYKQVTLGILQVLDDFCRKNEIKYSLACGTLLGAIRHKGFIPWDDDIDVYLLRKDYNRLMEIFPRELSNVSIHSLGRSPQWNRPYAKAVNNLSVEIENARNTLPDIGIGIDIFPIDFVPNSDREWVCFNRRRLFLQKVYAIKALIPSPERGILKNTFTRISQIVLLPFSFRRIASHIDRLSQKYNNNPTDSLFENCLGLISKSPFKACDFEDTIDVLFEGFSFSAMTGFDDYLSSTYGDYMKLPPIEKRVSHHDFKAFMK